MKRKQLLKKQVLTPFEADLMYAVGCLCDEGAVSTLNFTDIFSPEKNHEIIGALESLAIQGYLKYYDGVLYGTKGSMWRTMKSNHYLIQEMLGRLVEKTTISLYQDRTTCRDFFLMAYSFAKHIEKTSYNIDYTIFAELACNVAQFIDFWYPQNQHAVRTVDIPIVRILTFALNKIPSKSPLVSRLHSYMSVFFTNAWRYDIALKHLKAAEDNDLCLYGVIKDSTCMAYAEYYYNYCQLAVALKYYYTAFEKSNDEYIKVSSFAKIGLILALLGEAQFNDWLQQHTHYLQSLPEIHELKIYYYLILAMQEDSLVEATNYINRAKLIIIQLNHKKTPIGGVLHYIYSEILSIYAYKRRSLIEYKMYVLNSVENFKADEGGWDLLFTYRIAYHLTCGSLTTAKMLSIRELDSIVDIYSSDLSFSVRAEVCHAYVRLYNSLHSFPLALTYNQIYDDQRKLYKPSQKVLKYIAPLFNDSIPTTITLDTGYETAFEKLHIEIYMVEQRQSSGKTIEDIRKKIDELRLQYPELNVWLLIAEGRLNAHKDIRKAVETWKRAIELADSESLFWVAREVGNWCAYYGAIYEAADLYKLAIHSELFQKKMPDYFKFDYYLEYVSIIEKTGYRSLATPYWNLLETIANEEQLPLLYYNRALVEFDQEQWSNCRVYLTDFFSLYKQTEQHDEILSSAYCYYCSVLTRFGEYLEGLKSIQKSFALWIAPDSFDTFPLYCNKAHCEIGLNDFSSARKTLKQAEKFVGGSTENKQMLDDLYEFLHEQRIIYFKKDKL